MLRAVWASALYPVATAFSILLRYQLNIGLNPIVSLLLCVVFATIFFHVINYKNIQFMYRQAFKYLRASVVVNFLIAIIWVSGFVSLLFIAPFAYAVIFFSIPAIMVNIEKSYAERKGYYLFSALALIGLVLYYLLHVYLVNESHKMTALYGIAIAVLSGAVGLPYQKCAKRYLAYFRHSATMVLAVRSYGIILACGLTLFVLTLAGVHYLPAHWSHHLIGILILVVLLSFVLPLYLNQKGVGNAGPLLHSCIIASCPLITFILSYSLGVGHNLDHSLQSGMIALLITFFLILPHWFSAIMDKRR